MSPAAADERTAARESVVRESAGAVAIAPPRSPRTLAETGLNPIILQELVLKFLAVRGTAIGIELGYDIGLSFPILEPILIFLKEQKFIEVVSGDLMGPISYRYMLTEAGRNRAREALTSCHYIGPAPVTIDQYVRQTRLQAVRGIACDRESLGRVFGHLVLSEQLIEELGPAVVSGRSVLIYGPPGSGKTAISKALGEFLNTYGGEIWVPYALLGEASVVTVFDPLLHRPIDRTELRPEPAKLEDVFNSKADPIDRRWIRIRRPVVVAGGELTLDMLDLRYMASGNIYQAPLHMKANGGVFLIDDFGRQIVSPRDLLNRWILPLEERQDFLTLATGKKICVPFEQLILFATNLQPQQLVDDAFLRRIRHKVLIAAPDRPTYEHIFEKMCGRLGMTYQPAIVDYLYNRYYDRGREPRCSDPRDLLEIVESLCRFRGMETELHEDLVAEATQRFFGEF